MNSCDAQVRPSSSNEAFLDPGQTNPQTAIFEAFFPGFSLISSALLKYAKIDLSLYLPMLFVLGLIIFVTRYCSDWAWDFVETHAMSSADIRVDDEIYNMLMAWVANQQFAKRTRRFVANTNLNTRSWLLSAWFQDREDEEEEEADSVGFDADGNPVGKIGGSKGKEVRFTPSFGTHYFWYKKHLLLFRRAREERQNGYGSVSEREEISICCFGRNPEILKTLLEECRTEFKKGDETRTVIYRGGSKTSLAETSWTRCISRASRPFSTVVLDETVKQNLLDDMRDYLHPYTRRWYSNRGIPYRRGYLLHGPPGTGKSSLSFAIAGYFKLKIYIVSLNSPSMDEETLGTLFSQLPKQCVVLLEDIDTAGLTHTRGDAAKDDTSGKPENPASANVGKQNTERPGRISLSALLNILDGVASQEGRVLIMTTNHIEKLDSALIRPGRVDMTVKFDLATTSMLATIFRSIFATLEGDIPPSAQKTAFPRIRSPKPSPSTKAKTEKDVLDEKLRQEEEARLEKEFAEKKKKEEEKVEELSRQFADAIPSMVFSPAEIQGYLLKYKREPEKAVQGAKDWVKETMTEKRKQAEKDRQDEEARLKKEREDEEARIKKEKEDEEKEAKEKVEKLAAEKKLEEKKALVNGVKDDE
ncbi:hypothetical protein HYFRA_00000303 [Hymenoscyphus fraxineus]|uniref:Uncharacterized protein n=1 Tax=Hymenoscyphus fraxineus TaxID=746836 RepID=A0A9N9L586_9HELO|nr:hypothetical protein HYFRA_00000303 [Hymenoscyphus fraxineus]